MFFAERSAMARQAFERLSKPKQAALTLRLRDGLAPSVIGRRLGLTIGEVRLLLADAKAELEDACGALPLEV